MHRFVWLAGHQTNDFTLSIPTRLNLLVSNMDLVHSLNPNTAQSPGVQHGSCSLSQSQHGSISWCPTWILFTLSIPTRLNLLVSNMNLVHSLNPNTAQSPGVQHGSCSLSQSQHGSMDLVHSLNPNTAKSPGVQHGSSSLSQSQHGSISLCPTWIFFTLSIPTRLNLLVFNMDLVHSLNPNMAQSPGVQHGSCSLSQSQHGSISWCPTWILFMVSLCSGLPTTILLLNSNKLSQIVRNPLTQYGRIFRSVSSLLGQPPLQDSVICLHTGHSPESGGRPPVDLGLLVEWVSPLC